ncbi:restriction endonuclease subunit S [Streptomyces cellulosae]|uniref:restriction endonuclease subunit S n=1 Tax=Streptomyces TaxID=1883 RepID=UPI0013692283|nr:restriction endonuclease subunit S [Streptomyces cellulosae]MYQ30981.1 restriction endonuclease subunit S [Streptomyces sp. SID4956]WTB83300.1 restriction endonuclease subunit S [Streptomyces cellulosae]WTC57502.1 restriction endonuclease subunit S [Streptomyces cellulosae]
MSTWATSTLGELCEISIGKTPARAERQYWGGDRAWLSIADMNQGRELHHTKEYVTEAAAAGPAGRLVAPGTLLLSFKLSVGKLGFARIPMYTNEAIAALPVKNPSLVDSGFLYWALRRTDLLRNADDAAMGKNLNKKKLASVEVSLPSLAEQRRIAAVLDQADSLRTKRRAAIALLDDLTQSVFLDMFATDNPEWPETTVEELTQGHKGSIRTGPFGSQLLHEEFTDSGIPVLGIDNAVHNEFRWGERRYITEEKYEQLKRYTVFPGDVLITIMGTCGRCAIVPDDIPTAINTKHLCCITLDQRKCLPEFLHSYFLMHPVSRSYLTRTAKGAIMTGLNMGIIKELPVRLPPISLQQEYVNQLHQIRASRELQECHLSALDELFASVQHRAFSGILWDHEAAA